jgi:hypothetical protein
VIPVALTVPDVLVEVVAAVERLRAGDRLIVSAVQMLAEFEVLRDVARLIDAEMVHRARDMVTVEATSEAAGGGGCGRRCCSPVREAAQLVKLLHQLPSFPVTEAALDAAVISMPHASGDRDRVAVTARGPA